MASSVFYKFKSQRDESRITFDGTGISVFDLKKEIILAHNLAKANDFDLAVLDTSGEELKDDSHIIPRSSSVVVKRVPAARPGRGKAGLYVAAANASAASDKAPSSTAGASWGKGGMSRRFDNKDEQPKSNTPTPAPTSLTGAEDEAAAMAAMFQAQTANWEETQEKMSHATRIYTNARGTGFGGRGGKPFQSHQHSHSDRPLPPSYVCYRCGKKGHWIQDCPTNSDREFDNKPRIKRTTGIPRSFLKAVESPSTANGQSGVMVTPEGGYVVAQPDSASWQKRITRPKVLTEADIRERAPSDPALACAIDNKLFRDAVKTPCCGSVYCEECVQTHLLEKDFACPACGVRIASLDRLVADAGVRKKVGAYVEREIEASRREAEEGLGQTGVGTPNAQTPAPDASSSTPPEPSNPTTVPQSTSPTSTSPDTNDTNNNPFFMDPQLAGDLAMHQMVADTIPQLQAQIQQISLMVQNPSLPQAVRQQTEAQYQNLQVQLAQAQAVAAALNMNMGMMGMGMGLGGGVGVGVGMPGQGGFGVGAGMGVGQQGGSWAPTGGGMGVGGGQGGAGGGGGGGQFTNQQQPGAESAYQRLPLNNRRRNLKRERPSDFLEIAGPDAEREGGKMARYWE